MTSYFTHLRKFKMPLTVPHPPNGGKRSYYFGDSFDLTHFTSIFISSDQTKFFWKCLSAHHLAICNYIFPVLLCNFWNALLRLYKSISFLPLLFMCAVLIMFQLTMQLLPVIFFAVLAASCLQGGEASMCNQTIIKNIQAFNGEFPKCILSTVSNNWFKA